MKKNTIILSLSCLALLLVASVITISKISSIGEEKTIIISNLLAKINKNQLLGLSDLAVTGTIQDIQSFATSSKALTGQEEVYSNLKFKIDSYLYNPKSLEGEEIIIQIPGGKVGELSTFVEDSPTPELNHSYVMFLKKENTNNLFSSIGAQGFFEIDNDTVGGSETQKDIIKNIFNKDLTIEELKVELETATPETMPGQIK